MGGQAQRVPPPATGRGMVALAAMANAGRMLSGGLAREQPAP